MPISGSTLSLPQAFDIHSLTSLVRRGITPDRRPTPVLATGIAALDQGLHGGLPEGGLIELTGAPAAGKLSLALAIAARLLERGELAGLIDPEATVHPDLQSQPALGSLLVVRGG